ncbi:hypothetical protein [Streptomyces sp. NPDC060031]|uniref:hypothetical protein n=1 Tax=Streptomyces sp. NPDC060031 TaxID=3347043 RepID=UPI00367F2C9C
MRPMDQRVEVNRLLAESAGRREVQGLWPELRPAFDRRAREGARALGLPGTPEGLAELVPEADLPRLAAALVRTRLTHGTPDRGRSGA